MNFRHSYKLLALFTAVLAMTDAAVAQAPSVDSTTLMLQGSYRFFDSPVNPDWFLVRPGDQLRATFIGARINSMTFTVDPEGRIVDQSLGVIELSGTTLTEARIKLHEALQQHFTVEDIDIAIVAPQRVSITVSGAVPNPGLYLGFTSQRVSEIIDEAGGILPTGSRRNIQFQSARRSLRIDLDRAHYLGDEAFDPPLYAGTHIYVPTKSSKLVHVIGEVVYPRDIEFVEGDNLEDLLLLAGGTLPRADVSHIVVTTAGGDGHDRQSDIRAGDVISVPRLTSADAQMMVKLFGSIAKPGIYAISNGEKLVSLVERAGGFVADANKSRTTIFRQINAEQYQAASGSRFAIASGMGEYGKFEQSILKAGDSIFVPPMLDFVRVRGAVPNPSYVPYKEGQTASYYIDACGGFNPDADRNWISIFNRVAGLASLHSIEVVVRDGDEIEVRRQENSR